MNSKEIEKAGRTVNDSPKDYSEDHVHIFWLKEIAYQLSVMNEQTEANRFKTGYVSEEIKVDLRAPR